MIQPFIPEHVPDEDAMWPGNEGPAVGFDRLSLKSTAGERYSACQNARSDYERRVKQWRLRNCYYEDFRDAQSDYDGYHQEHGTWPL